MQHTQSTEIDSSISQAIRNSNKISMTKNIFSDNCVETAITAEKTSFKRNTVDVWPGYGYFKQQPCDFTIEKENFPENSIFYLNQSYQSVKGNKKIYYANMFLIGQVNECFNPPEDLHSYECGDQEEKMYRPKYDKMMCAFLGLYETLGYIMVRGDPQEHFLDYGFCKKNSKILHSHYKKRFLGTFFNRHRIQYKYGAFQGLTFSNIYYFLPSTTDRVEEINRQVGSINLTPIDIPENTFEVEDNVQFDPSKLDYECKVKEKITKAVVKMLEKIIDISNSNLIKNVNDLLSTESVDEEVK